MKKISDEKIYKAIEIYCKDSGFDEGEPTEEIKLPKKCGTKRINVSINENDYEELKNYCHAKGYSISGFVVQTSMQAVKADVMLSLMRTLVSSLTLSDALTEADKAKILGTISAMETLQYGGDNNG